MKELIGHGVALITPFKSNGAIDFDAIPKIIKCVLGTHKKKAKIL